MSVITKRRRVAPPPPATILDYYYIPELEKTFFQKFKDRGNRGDTNFPKTYGNNVRDAFQYYTDLQDIVVNNTYRFNFTLTPMRAKTLATEYVKYKNNFPAFKELSQDPLSTYEKLEDKIIIPTIWPSVNIDITRLTTPTEKEILAILLSVCINAKKELKREIIPGEEVTLDNCYIGVRKKSFRDYLNEVYGDTIPIKIKPIIIEILTDIEIKGSTYEYDFEDKIFILDASQNNIIFIGNKLPEPPKPRTTSLTNEFLNCLIVNTHNLYSSNAYYSDINNKLANLFNPPGAPPPQPIIDFGNNSGVYFFLPAPAPPDIFKFMFDLNFLVPAVPPTMPDYIQINDGYAYLDRIYCMFDKLHDMKTRNKSPIYNLVYEALIRLIRYFKYYISYTTIPIEEKTLYINFMSHFEKNIKNKHIEKQLCLFMAYLLNKGNVDSIIKCPPVLARDFLLPTYLNNAADVSSNPNNLRNYCKTNTINIDLLHTSPTGPIDKLHKIGKNIYSMPELIDNGHNYPDKNDNPIFKFTTNKKQVIIPFVGGYIIINMFSHLYITPPPAVQELYYIVLYQIIININSTGSQTYYVIHKINIEHPPHNKEIYNAIQPRINFINQNVAALVDAVATSTSVAASLATSAGASLAISAAAGVAAGDVVAASINLIKDIIIDCIINSKSQQDEQNLLQLVNNNNDISIESICNPSAPAPAPARAFTNSIIPITKPIPSSKTNIYTIDQIAVSIAMLIATTNPNKIAAGSSAFFYYNKNKSCIGFEKNVGSNNIIGKLCKFGMPVEDSVIADALLRLANDVQRAYDAASSAVVAADAVAAHTDTSIRKLQLLFRKRLKEISITLLAEEAATAAATEANRINALAAEAAEAAEATEAVAEAFAITAADATPVTITDIAKEAGYEFADSISRIKKGLYDIVNIQNLREMISIVGDSTMPIIDFVSNNNLTSVLGRIYNRVIQTGGNITRKKFNKSNRYKKFNKHKTLKYKKKNKTKKYKSISKRKNKTTKKNKAISKKKNNTTKKYKFISKKKNTKTYRVKHIHRKHFGSKGGGPIQTTYNNNTVSNDKGVSMYQKASGYIQNTYNNPVSKDQYVSKNQTDSEYIKNTYNNPVSNDKEVSTDQEESDYMQYTDNDVDDNALITYLCAHAKNIKDNAEEDENLPYDDNCHFYEKALNFYYPEKYEKVFLLLNEAEEYPLINLSIKYELLRLIIYSIEKQGNRGDEKKEERDEGKY